VGMSEFLDRAVALVTRQAAARFPRVAQNLGFSARFKNKSGYRLYKRLTTSLCLPKDRQISVLLMGGTVLAVVLTVLCVLAIVFLIYIFVQFWRETTRLKRRLEQKINESKAQTNPR